MSPFQRKSSPSCRLVTYQSRWSGHEDCHTAVVEIKFAEGVEWEFLLVEEVDLQHCVDRCDHLDTTKGLLDVEDPYYD